MKVLFISSVSATIELDNNELYYAAKSFDWHISVSPVPSKIPRT